MVVNYERVVLRLKEELTRKSSHSAAALLETIGRLEVECAIPEHEEGFDSRPRPRATERPLSAAR